MSKAQVLAGLLVFGLVAGGPASVVRADNPMMEDHEAKMDPQQWKSELGLSDEQVTNLKKIRDAQHDAMKSLHERQQQAMAKLEQQVQSKASDNDIKATLDEIKSVHQSMTDQHQQFMNQRADILTPTQQAKLLLKKKDRMKAMGHRMNERRAEKAATTH
jgi:Spy/CpxP family protein refolding chaperone